MDTGQASEAGAAERLNIICFRFHTQCFWSYCSDLTITLVDVPWVAEQLKKHGNRLAWDTGVRLCP